MSENISGRLPNSVFLSIEFNPHAVNYESVEDWEAHDTDGGKEESSFVTPEDRLESFRTQTLWTLQWYPNTPVGFNKVAAPTLERLLAAVEEQQPQPAVGT